MEKKEVRIISITFQHANQKAYFYWHPWKTHLQVKLSKILVDNALAPQIFQQEDAKILCSKEKFAVDLIIIFARIDPIIIRRSMSNCRQTKEIMRN